MILPEKYIEAEELLFDKALSIFRSLGDKETPDRIGELIEGIHNPFTILVVGEYNSGKSSFINALLDIDLLNTGVTPTTDRINIITSKKKQSDSNIEFLHIENDITMQMDIVDTPGTNSIFREHQEIVESYIKLADFIIFLTSTERPLSESEVMFLKMIRGKWDRKLIVCINKIDLVNDDDLIKIKEYVRDNLWKIIDIKPEIFLISSIKDKKGISDIMDYLLKKLSSRHKIALKLSSPLRALMSIISDNNHKIESHLEYIDTDLHYIDKLDDYIDITKKDILNNIAKYKDDIERIFEDFINKMKVFIDNTINLGFVFRQIFQRKHIKLELENMLSEKDNPLQQLNGEIDKISHFTSISCKSLYHQSIDYITNNIAKKSSDINILLKREYIDREKELYYRALENSKVYREVDIEKESIELKSNINQGFRSFLTMQGLAVGAGITLVGILQGALIDLTGIVLSITLASYGFILFPYKRRKMKRELETKTRELKNNLWIILIREMSHYILEVENNIKSIFSSHKSFLIKEKHKISQAHKQFAELLKDLKDLDYKIQKDYK